MDLEQFDFQLSNHLSNLHLEDVSTLYLDFSGLKPNGHEIEVSNQNLQEYIIGKTQFEMMESRRENLKLVREGFYYMKELKEHLQMLQVNDYHILLTGEQRIDIESVVQHCIVFLPSAQNQQQQQETWLKQVLQQLTQEEFKQFLLFCTGYSTTQSKDKLFENGNLQSGYARDKINVRFMKQWKSDRLPESHVCFYLLDLPFYESEQQLEIKLRQAIQNTSNSFTMA